MLQQYLDQLSPERQAVFKKLKHFADRFTLAGGTAIMLQIGHRLSLTLIASLKRSYQTCYYEKQGGFSAD